MPVSVPEMTTPSAGLLRPISTKPALMTVALIAADAFSLLLATGVGLASKYAIRGSLDISAYVVLWPYLLVFLLVFGIAGLYPGVALSAPDELRRVMISSLVVFVSLAAATMSR